MIRGGGLVSMRVLRLEWLEGRVDAGVGRGRLKFGGRGGLDWVMD